MEKKDNKDLPATTESQDIFERFDAIDDKIIIQELENQVVDDWVYHFVVEGKDVWGLGKVGIDACTRKMGEKGVALREDYVNYGIDPTHPEYVLFTASVSKHVVSKAGAEATVESAIGTKRQWIMLRRKIQGVYKIVANKFWFEQGSIKALRNAKSRLIPEDIKTKIITYAKTHKKVREIEPPAKKKEGDNGGPGKEEFKTIPITQKNKTVMHTKFEALERFKEAKAQLGTQLYYKVLGEHGYEKSNQIPDKDIPKIYYALLETHESIKKPTKKPAEEEEASEKEKPAEKKKPAVFSDDEEKELELKPETEEKVQLEMPTQAERMELTKLEVILVDKHDFTPDQVIGKIIKMFGGDKTTKLTKEQNKEAIEYFKGEIEKFNEAK
ncbi:hypothetical protein ES703_81906 [subsurface metagenome]|nr:hypothetical protein [bacterium]